MSTKQPDALEQAEYLEKGWFDEERNRITAAAELRRLHAANAEMLYSLRCAVFALTFAAETLPEVRSAYQNVSDTISKHGAKP